MARKRSIDGIGIGVVVAIRLSPAMIAALDVICEREGKNRSVILRDLLVLYLGGYDGGADS